MFFDVTDCDLGIVITYSKCFNSSSFFFAWLRLRPDQATCMQPEALVRTNRHTIMKESIVVLAVTLLHKKFQS